MSAARPGSGFPSSPKKSPTVIHHSEIASLGCFLLVSFANPPLSSLRFLCCLFCGFLSSWTIAVQYSEEEKATFGSDVEAAMAYRQRLMRNLNGIHAVTMKDSEMQKGAMVAFAENMRTKLVKKPEIAQALQPTFPAGCRRLTPGPGYFEALVEDNVGIATVASMFNISALGSKVWPLVDSPFLSL